MAHFYGTVQGHRGEASRLGTAASGLNVKATSWQGAVAVHLYTRDGIDYARVSLAKHYGAGRDVVLFNGPVSGVDLAGSIPTSTVQALTRDPDQLRTIFDAVLVNGIDDAREAVAEAYNRVPSEEEQGV